MLSTISPWRYATICGMWPDDPNELYLEIIDEYNTRAPALGDGQPKLAPGLAVVGGVSELIGYSRNGGLFMFMDLIETYNCRWLAEQSVESLFAIGCIPAAEVLKRAIKSYDSHKTGDEAWQPLDVEFGRFEDEIVSRTCEYFKMNKTAFVLPETAGGSDELCDETIHRTHMTAFVNSFVSHNHRERWLHLLVSRPAELLANSSKLHMHLDRRYCREMSDPTELVDSDTGVFEDFVSHSQPVIVNACRAVYLANERDSLYSILPGERVVCIFHQGSRLVVSHCSPATRLPA